jgi:hypothetical protein
MNITSSNTLCNGTGSYGNITNITINSNSRYNITINKTNPINNITYIIFGTKTMYFGSNSTTMSINYTNMIIPYNSILYNNALVANNVTNYYLTINNGDQAIMFDYYDTPPFCGSFSTTTLLSQLAAAIPLLFVVGMVVVYFYKRIEDEDVDFDLKDIGKYIMLFLVIVIITIITMASITTPAIVCGSV